MANVLNTDKQIAVIAALAEGSSIRATERMTSIHRGTISRLGVRVGHPKRHVTVLHIPPVVSRQTAVQAVIVQEYKNRDRSKEN